MRKRRGGFDPKTRAEYDLTIYKKLAEDKNLASAAVVMTYVSIGSEADTARLINLLLERGQRVCVPVVCGKELELSYISGLDGLVRTSLGVLEPPAEIHERCDKAEVDAVIVPALAFDKSLFRIGYGGGFYDRFLSGISAVKIGICYDFCVVEDFFPESHDVKVDYIITN